MFVPANDGRWVDENFARMAEIIHDYDHGLEFRWIPPEHRQTMLDKKQCYVVWDTRTNTPVMYASETDTPEGILTRLFAGDNAKHNVVKNLEAAEKAKKLMQMKEWLEEREAMQDEALFWFKNQKSVVWKDGIKYDEHFRRIGERRRYYS